MLKFNKKIFKFMLFFVLTLNVLWIVIDQQFTISENNRKLSVQNEQLAVLDEQTDRLNKQKSQMDTPEYKERIARERAGMIKPNETLFVDTLNK